MAGSVVKMAEDQGCINQENALEEQKRNAEKTAAAEDEVIRLYRIELII